MSIESMGDDFMRKYGSSPKRKHKKRVRKSFSSGGQGWENESERHQMASYGIKTGRKQREYAPKSTFRSAPLIKAGVGGAVFGLKAVGGFLAKRKADADRKKAEEDAKKKVEQEKEDYYYDGKITPAKEPIQNRVPFVKQLRDIENKQAWDKARLNAMQNKEEQFSRVLEAKRKQEQNKSSQETKEQIEKDYASV